MKNLFFLVILAVTSTVAFANNGMSAFNRKDYNEAYRIWSRSPDTAESQYGLGLLHYEGLGGPKNTERGLSLLRGASEKGYRPATEYLATVFEKTGDSRSALRFLERLQTQERTLKTQERIVDAQKKLVKGSPAMSADYCSAVNELIKLGGTPENEVPERCALNGLASPVSPENARQWLSRGFQKTPSIEALDVLVQDFLDPRKPSFNPLLIEEAIWTLDPDLTNRTIKATLIEKGKVSQETCLSLPFREPDQRVRFSSYCALVVIAGVNKNPLISAREYVNGTQGRVGVRTPDRVPKGLKLLSLQKDVYESLDGILLQMEAARNLVDWRRSLELFQQNIKALAQSKSPLIEREVRYILDRVNISSQTRDDSRFFQADAKELSELIDSLPGEVELKKYACAVLAPYIGPDYTHPHDFLGKGAEALTQALERLCTSAGIKRPDPKTKPPAPDESTRRTSPAQSPNSEIQQSPPKVIDSQTQTTNFDKALFDCNQGVATACAPAAQAILGKNPPQIYQSLTREQRIDVAEKLLSIGAKVNDSASLATLWDIYEGGLDSSKRPTAQRYLSTLLARGEPAGLLRQEIASLPKDPVTALLGFVVRQKYVNSCNTILSLRDGGKLSAYDKDIADAVYNGLMCTSLRVK
jgi:hypothetical protein